MDKVKAIITVIGTALSSIFGALSPLVLGLVISMVGDYITGMVKASYTNTLNSKVGMWGIIKKLLYMLFVGVAMGVDWLLLYLSQNMGLQVSGITFFGALVTIWLIINEWISMLENITAVVGADRMPKCLMPIIKKLKTVVESQSEEK